MINKAYCMSSYLAFRYIVDDKIDFFDNMSHKNYKPLPEEQKIKVKNADEIDVAIKEQIARMKREKLGILLSGGMDSAILASYMSGCDAYTFRFEDGIWQTEELKRAERYAEYYGLNLHYIDINWKTIQPYVDITMKRKGAPVHSIEPQIVQAALQAKSDGIERMIIGNAADYVFGGMDKLLSKDWKFEDFVQRYIYINPIDILNEPVEVTDIFKEYKMGDRIDFISFMNKYAVIESYGSYENAFDTANMPYTDLYEKLMMADVLDLLRIRKGESKYLIRELFQKKYPHILIPEKNPMPRPVDSYFAKWGGPKRKEFKQNLDMMKFTGNQKWQIWCLERFLNMVDAND